VHLPPRWIVQSFDVPHGLLGGPLPLGALLDQGVDAQRRLQMRRLLLLPSEDSLGEEVLRLRRVVPHVGLMHAGDNFLWWGCVKGAYSKSSLALVTSLQQRWRKVEQHLHRNLKDKRRSLTLNSMTSHEVPENIVHSPTLAREYIGE